MAGFWKRRKAVKVGREWLKHAELCRNMKEDIAPPAVVERVLAAERAVRDAVVARDGAAIEKASGVLQEALTVLAPPRPMAGVRENVEVILVAVAVAMAFRAFFLQPFKIPTGSMQPTLYGIHYSPQAEATVFDRLPLKFVKWLVFGETYTEFAAQATGVLRGPYGERGGLLYYDIGGIAHGFPRELALTVKPGAEVVAGQVLARGNRIHGDHLFVNRVSWNFRRPQRGEVMVFRTDDIPIPNLTERTHYIKRLCGLPGERISIEPPRLRVNGVAVDQPEPIGRIARREPGYAGYHHGPGAGADYLGRPGDVLELGAGQYAAFGDNTLNSLDSRYWGPVPEANLVGPAWVVYWPLSRRWGAVK
jgi:signal peptidase I